MLVQFVQQRLSPAAAADVRYSRSTSNLFQLLVGDIVNA
jgi:hypothetical protein